MNIVITGASRGIGFESAKRLAARENNNIVAIARNERGLKDLKTACIRENVQSHLFPIVFDLEQSNQIEEGLKPKILEHISTVDMLINNAGLLINKPFAQLTDGDIARLIQTNFTAPLRIIRMLIPHMSQQGHIVNIGSMGGYQGSEKFKGLSVYSATKAALGCLTECLAAEFSEIGLSFNCLALGAADTEMLREAFPDYTAPVSANSMAEFIAEFAYTGSRYFNGKILPVSITNP